LPDGERNSKLVKAGDIETRNVVETCRDLDACGDDDTFADVEAGKEADTCTGGVAAGVTFVATALVAVDGFDEALQPTTPTTRQRAESCATTSHRRACGWAGAIMRIP
jgi:hypothetical protein